jgi:hypothetical protein
MSWNHFTLEITSCHRCPYTQMDANKTRVECSALNNRPRLCWLGDEDKLETIPDFCPFLSLQKRPQTVGRLSPDIDLDSPRSTLPTTGLCHLNIE